MSSKEYNSIGTEKLNFWYSEKASQKDGYFVVDLKDGRSFKYTKAIRIDDEQIYNYDDKEIIYTGIRNDFLKTKSIPTDPDIIKKLEEIKKNATLYKNR